MLHKILITLAVCFPVYLLTVLLTDLSLSGFWTDVIFSIICSLIALLCALLLKTDALGFVWVLRILNALATLLVFGLILLNFLTNMFITDTFKLRSFYFLQVDGRLFNVYFKPVGAYGGGYGEFWIAETPIYFPIIEWQVYSESTVHYDFNDDTFDSESTDHVEVAKNYIQWFVKNSALCPWVMQC